jgi:hypothetical protein
MWPGSHVVTEDAHLWLESHLCDWSRILVMSFVTGVTNTRPETQLCDCSSCKSTRGHAHQNSIYSRPFGSDFSFPSHVLLYFHASNQVTRYIVTHTRDSINQHYQGNNYIISLGWYHNRLQDAPVTFCHRLPLPRKVCIAGHLGLIPLSPLMYYFTFMQATLIHLHNKTRSALVIHHYYCLGTSSNQPWWI